MSTYVVAPPLIAFFEPGKVSSSIVSVFGQTTPILPFAPFKVSSAINSVFSGAATLPNIGGITISLSVMFSAFTSYVDNTSQIIVYYEQPLGVLPITAGLPPPLRWGAGNAIGVGF